MKVDFFVPGFSKCGTTSLCALLAEHPDIFMPSRKEPNYFAHRKDEGWKWYESWFRGSQGAKRIGEGSTVYSTAEYAEQACRGILEIFPQARFIFIARNPLARLESSYREMHDRGAKWGINTPYSVGEALRALPNMIHDTRYWKLINIYRNHVPDDRIHVLFAEDLKTQPAVELARCFRFLNVDSGVSIDNPYRELNTGSQKYYDSRLMRLIRTTPALSRLQKRIPRRIWAKTERLLRLRRPFRRKVELSPETVRYVHDELGDDARQFLEFYGKPADFWDLTGRSSNRPQRRAA